MWSHSEKDSGFRPSAEPGVPEEEEMRAPVSVQLERVPAEVPAHGALALRQGVLSPHHRSVCVCVCVFSLHFIRHSGMCVWTGEIMLKLSGRR